MLKNPRPRTLGTEKYSRVHKIRDAGPEVLANVKRE